ncbi:cyclin-domain-containing protein [Globomyces pollinis-pini]|nr:cyclin-domain-containing protein [Globomyces pollinis-pini]
MPVSPKRVKIHHPIQTQLLVLPPLIQDCQPLPLIDLIAQMIDQILLYNDKLPTTMSQITRFHSRSIPNISVGDYLIRFQKYLSLDNSILVIILIFIDRISKDPQLPINSLTIHRFILATITISSKHVSDVYPKNSIFAKIGGITLGELNMIEMELCKSLNWRLSCPFKLIQNYYINLVLNHPLYTFPCKLTIQPSNSDVYLDQLN